MSDQDVAIHDGVNQFLQVEGRHGIEVKGEALAWTRAIDGMNGDHADARSSIEGAFRVSGPVVREWFSAHLRLVVHLCRECKTS